MAARVTTQGRLRIGIQASQATTYSSAAGSDLRAIQVMSVDNSATALADSTTTLGSPGSEFDQVFDAQPTTATDATSATITHITTYGTANGNFAISRVILHDDTTTNVTGTSTTVVAGVDAQSLTKTSDFTLAITLRLKYT
jgi:hypothetical protein